MHRLTCGLALAFASGSVWGQTLDLAQDDRLSKPITVAAKMRPVGEVVSDLAKQAGVALDTGTNIRDLKCNAFAKDLPARLAMQAVAEALDLQWSQDGSGYRLRLDTDTAQAMRIQLRDEAKSRRKAAEGELAKLAEVAIKSYEQARQSDPSLTADRYFLGLTARNLNAAQKEGLWSGSTIRAMMPHAADGAEVKVLRAILQYNPVSGQLRTIGSSPSALRSFLIDPKASVSGAYADRASKWASVENSPELDARVGPINPLGDGWSNGQISTSDALAAFHQASGTPVFSDAFRVAIHQKTGGSTALGWLKQFAAGEGAYLRVANGVAMLRHGGYWRLREWEPIESDFAALERKPVTLEAYASFAAKLTSTQGLAMQAMDGFLVRVSRQPFERALPALRFYASLGSNQALAKAQRPIPYAQLGASQRDLFLAALAGELEGGLPVGQLGSILPDRDANSLAFLLSPSEVVGVVGRELQPGVRLQFGTSERDGITFQVVLGAGG